MLLSGHTTWWLLGGPFLFLVAQMGVENIPLTLLAFFLTCATLPVTCTVHLTTELYYLEVILRLVTPSFVFRS